MRHRKLVRTDALSPPAPFYGRKLFTRMFCPAFASSERRVEQNKMNTKTPATELDTLINFALKEGYISDDAQSWTPEEKQSYFNVCNAYSPSND